MPHSRTHFDFARLARAAAGALLALAGLAGPAAQAQTTSSGSAQAITWTCTGTPCPWGSSLSGRALVWPTGSGATSARLGYTTSQPVYLPADRANGTTLTITSGTGMLYAGTPGGSSHRLVRSVAAGTTVTVSGIATGEVLSVQGSASFSWSAVVTAPPPPPPPPPPTPTPEVPVIRTASQAITWTCTGTPCPWGSPLTGQALVWPDSAGASNLRLGYTTSAAIYLPASRANGAIIWLDSGSVTLFAGLPGTTSHRVLGTINAGGSFTVSGLASTEVLSVQSPFAFTYQIDLLPPPPPPPPPPPTGLASEAITWTCTGTPCPWGNTLSGSGIVWPASTSPLSNRMAYTTSRPVYLPQPWANGVVVAITSGSATVYAGLPGNTGSHRTLTTISAGGTFTVTGLLAGEVVSVQGGGATFTYQITLPPPPPPPPPGEQREIIQSVFASWRCDIPTCTTPDWIGAVINWPSWAAYGNNARAGNLSRTVYSRPGGEPLYPYMGSWANGCEVTAEAGEVLIIEWQRGTNVWRETYIYPGQTHTIRLTSPEDGAMIEANDNTPGFAVSLKNCTPRPLP